MNIGVVLVAVFRDDNQGGTTVTVREDVSAEGAYNGGTYERRSIRGIDASGNTWRLVERCELTKSDACSPVPPDRWKPLRWERETAVNVPFCRPEVEG